LNGTPVLSRGWNDFLNLYTETISTGFQPGVNSLTFSVYDMDSWDGLFISQISGEATPTVPEPATIIVWSLLGGCGIALGWLWNRKAR
jgi:hypothetical protein